MKLANMNPQLRDLLQVHTNSLVGDIDTLVQMADRNFEQDLYPLWIRVDERIPGPGLQYAYWMQGELRDYPFDYEFEQVLRPLRYVVYVVYGLHDAHKPSRRTRELVSVIGGHLEGCVKDLCGVTKINQPMIFRRWWVHRPLGTLVSKKNPMNLWLRQRLGKKLCRAITSFCQLLWNPAKHKYETRPPSSDPMIPFADAVAGYFLARALGAKVLRASGRLEPVVQAIRNERNRRAGSDQLMLDCHHAGGADCHLSGHVR